jgi:methyl-accepting chemotaxis protein
MRVTLAATFRSTPYGKPESAKYWEQPWYKDGMNAPKGECAWAKAYQDAASPQPRTNCAMDLKDGKAWAWRPLT